MGVEIEIPIGTRFDMLVIESGPMKVYDEKVGRLRTYYRAKCDCGNTTTTRKDRLGKECMSCGCLNKSLIAKHVDNCRTHGMGNSRLYRTWHAMNRRCTDENDSGFHNYGGRGIKVCQEWQTFENFRDWALSSGYSDKLEIDRIEVNGNYEPGNCRWATDKEQANNRRDTIRFSAFGETKTLMDWAKDARCSVSSGILRNRIRIGWNPETAMKLGVHEKQLNLAD